MCHRRLVDMTAAFKKCMCRHPTCVATGKGFLSPKLDRRYVGQIKSVPNLNPMGPHKPAMRCPTDLTTDDWTHIGRCIVSDVYYQGSQLSGVVFWPWVSCIE